MPDLDVVTVSFGFLFLPSLVSGSDLFYGVTFCGVSLSAFVVGVGVMGIVTDFSLIFLIFILYFF